eukprot:scaffold6378_cov176-Amphora_coffeaeformis.AAC.11
MLTGTLFWGCLFSGVIVGGFVGLIFFLFLYQGSIYYIQRATAIIIGIAIIVVLRIGIMCYGRSRYFKSFYRKRPAAANIYFLAMEWANFALTAGFVFLRLVKLLLVAGLSVGRIDTPFLAKGVGELGPLELDPCKYYVVRWVPTIHMRDIMMHDAHRHPYIEALGTIYLMKLRYGRSFCSNAGSSWRLLFVYSLMPWMQKYRIFDTSKQQNPQKSEEYDLSSSFSGTLGRSSRVAPRLLTDIEMDKEKQSREQIIKRLRQENEELKARLAEMERKTKEKGYHDAEQ